LFDYSNDEMNLPTFLEDATVEYLWSFAPRRCRITNNLIWFKKAYRASAEYRTDTVFYRARRWFTKEAYIKYLLEL